MTGQTNINEFVQELRNYFGIPLVKEIILTKITGLPNKDAWRKESAASLLELLDLADTNYQRKNLQQALQEINSYYESHLNAN